MKHVEYIVSACLAGKRYRYDGKAKPCAAIIQLVDAGKAIPICPESLSSLPKPRPPAEHQPNGRILDKTGKDVTEEFEAGALRALKLAKQSGCAKAILKARSPSCGVGQIYDGTFRGILRDGDGVFTRKLKESGFIVMDEEQFME